MTDKDGNLVWFGNYTGWGRLKEETRVTDSAYQPFRLQNQYADRETGVHYNFFSYYDPDAGRFVNQDPIGVEGGFNFYRFTPNAQEWVDVWEPVIESRQILRDYNIDINDPANGIAVGHSRPHNEMHNRKFHEKIRDRLKNVVETMKNRDVEKSN